MAAAVENMVATGTDGGAETGVTASPAPGATAAAAVAAAVPPAAPAPPLRKAKTKEGKGKVSSVPSKTADSLESFSCSQLILDI